MRGAPFLFLMALFFIFLCISVILVSAQSNHKEVYMGKGRHGHRVFERVIRMAKESGIPADCLVSRALDELERSAAYRQLARAHGALRKRLAETKSKRRRAS